MIQKDKVQRAPDWSREQDLNRWCDYIELLCIDGTDGLVSKDDIIEILSRECEEKGSDSHATNSDKIVHQINAMFEQIAYRNENISLYYPFVYEDGCLYFKEQLDKRQLQYIFLLICSSIAFLDGSSSSKMTKSFEEYCLPFFKCLVASDAETYLFGTSRSGTKFTGNLRSRVNQLADYFGIRTTKDFDDDPQFDVSGGDEGIDLVAFNKLDSASHIPIALGQCTCSYLEWENKQKDISREVWIHKISPLPNYAEYMFVPFFCRNATGKFEHPTTITTCLIDRLRLIKLLELHEDILGNIDSEYQMTLIETCCGDKFKQKIAGLLVTNDSISASA